MDTGAYSSGSARGGGDICVDGLDRSAGNGDVRLSAGVEAEERVAESCSYYIASYVRSVSGECSVYVEDDS